MVLTGAKLESKEAKAVGLVDEVLDKRDEVRLIKRCVDVLENKYFVSRYDGGGMNNVRLMFRQKSIENYQWALDNVNDIDGFLKRLQGNKRSKL